MKKFSMNEYLENAQERFSNFDAFDFEEEYNGIIPDDLDFDGRNAEAYPIDSVGAPVSPTPYQISIVNTTAGQLNAVIFGKNRFLQTTNFGSAVGITITPSQSNVNYIELLIQSADNPFETSLLRVQSTNTSQVTNIMTVTSKDANGQQCDIPIVTQSYFSANQFQSGIIDIPFNLKIDGNTYITYPVLANTTVIVTFFPKDKVNPARPLSGRPSMKPYGAPAVAIGIPTVNVRPLARR